MQLNCPHMHSQCRLCTPAKTIRPLSSCLDRSRRLPRCASATPGGGVVSKAPELSQAESPARSSSSSMQAQQQEQQQQQKQRGQQSAGTSTNGRQVCCVLCGVTLRQMEMTGTALNACIGYNAYYQLCAYVSMSLLPRASSNAKCSFMLRTGCRAPSVHRRASFSIKRAAAGAEEGRTSISSSSSRGQATATAREPQAARFQTRGHTACSAGNAGSATSGELRWPGL